MFAARVGKTTIAEMLLLCSVATAPASFLFGTSTETLAKQTVRKKLWPTFEQCEITREWCPAEHNRVQNRIDLRYCTGYVAWSGSPTTLADIGPRYSHANEVSKWTRDVSDEADPLELFRERGSEIPNRKMVGESTPTIEGGCRIYRELLAGTNERYHVPCPHCGAYQELLLGDGTPGSGGLIWDKTQDGNASPDLAGRTARYQCAACKREIGDEYKPGMTARGVWCPDGCAVDQRGKLQGTPLRSPYSRSFQLSRLYAPTFTFGDVARAFVRAAKVKSKEPELLRNFMNSWLGWPWREREQSRKWSEVAGRLCVPGTICRPPREAIFLTAGVDRQIDKLVYFVAAWGLGGRGWLVDYGNADTWADLLMTLDTTYIREDGREMGVLQTLVDSKFQQDQVDEFCRKNDRPQRRIWPSQGAKPGQLQGQSYRLGMIDKQKEAERKRGREGYSIVTVNTSYWQGYVDRCLYHMAPGDDGAFVFPASCRDDQDLFEQLLNEVVDPHKVPQQWARVSESIPVDFRDAWRYARCAAEIRVRKRWRQLRPVKGPLADSSAKPKPKTGVVSTASDVPFLSRPHGWVP